MTEPVPLVLTCPSCGARHVDEGEFATKIHHTHSCQACGLTWRPAIVPTVGVQFLPGFGPVEPAQGRIALTPRRRDDARKDALLFSRRTCTVPPAGWWCSRPGPHDGPCAARPIEGRERDPRCTSNECEIRDKCTGSARCPKFMTPAPGSLEDLASEKFDDNPLHRIGYGRGDD